MCLPADKDCEKILREVGTKSEWKTDSETFRKAEINMRADGVETHVVSSSGVSDSTSYCHAAALCEPLFRLKMEFSKGFHSLENHVSTGGSGAYKQVHSQKLIVVRHSILCRIIESF